MREYTSSIKYAPSIIITRQARHRVRAKAPPVGEKGRNVAEAPDRYCGNCGHELSPEDKFCRNCGTPAHVAAKVPTPEADVPVPPPPQAGGTGAAAPAQQPAQAASWREHPILVGCLGIIALFILLGIIGAALGGGGGGGGGGKKAAEKPQQEQAQKNPAQNVNEEDKKQPQQEHKASKPAPKPQYASVGEKVPIEDEAYQVNNAWKQNGIHSAMENRKGTFVVVDFTFYNMGSDTRTLDDTALTLQDSQGRSYNVIQDNYMVVPMSKDIFLEDVSPGVSKPGRAIFNVAPTANGFVLVCSHTNWLSSAEPAKIKLGF
jgi:hypothetical protein